MTLGLQFCWVLIVFVSFLGWGGLASLALRLEAASGLRICLGIAVIAAVSGWLVLLHAVSRPLLIAMVIGGVILALAEVRRLRWPRIAGGPVEWGFLAAALAIAAVTLAFSAFSPDFLRFDDYNAYLVFPRKLLETGALGLEPFSERRLVNGLGAYYALQAMVLAGSDSWFLHALDPGLGILAVMLMLSESLARLRAGPGWAAGLVLACSLIVPETFNLTAQLIPVSLIVALFFVAGAPVAVDGQRPGWRRAAGVALIAAALIAIKPLYLVVPGVFLLGIHLLRLFRHGINESVLGHAIGTAALIGAFLAPWMLVHWRDTGTLMYPLLGQGFHEARYGDYPKPWSLVDPKKVLGLIFMIGVRTHFIVIGALLTAWLLWTGLIREHRGHIRAWLLRSPHIPALLVFAAGLALFVEVGIAVNGEQLRRYAYPGIVAGMLVLMYAAGSEIVRHAGTERTGFRPRLRQAGVVAGGGVFAVLLVGTYGMGLQHYYVVGLQNARILAHVTPYGTDLFDRIERGRQPQLSDIRDLQKSVPPDAAILEHIDYPAMLDFRRNVIFLADWPGAAGPAPGFPYRKGPEELAAYLLASKIRYVAYMPDTEKFFPPREQLKDPTITPWSKVDVERGLDFEDNLNDLMKSRALAFRDADRVMIDLATRAGATRTASSARD